MREGQGGGVSVECTEVQPAASTLVLIINHDSALSLRIYRIKV